MRAHFFASLLLTAILSLGARGEAAAQAEWQVVVSEDKSVATEMPGAPKYSTAQLISGQGFPYTMHTYVYEKDAATFQVQTTVYPRDVTLNPQTNIQVGLDNAAKAMEGGKWASVAWVRHQGLMAADAVGVRSGTAVRVFSLIKGARLIMLTYVGPPDTARSPDVERFLKSLKVS